jgi:hypothetical protein
VKVSHIFIENSVETFKAIVADQTVMLFWIFFNLIFFFKIKNAVTHTSNSEKRLATVDWVPPKNFMGTVIFRWQINFLCVSTFAGKSHEVRKISFASPEIDCLIKLHSFVHHQDNLRTE